MTGSPALQHEDFALRHLRLPGGLSQRCADLGVHRVADIVAPRGVPASLPSDDRDLLVAAVARFCATPLPDVGQADLDRPLPAPISATRLRAALEALELEVVGDFLACPREDLLAVRGFGPRSWEKVVEAIRADSASAASPSAIAWLPDSLRALTFDQLPLDEATRAALLASSARNVGDLVRGAGPADEAVQRAVRGALQRVLRVAPTSEPSSDTFPGMLRQLRNALDQDDRPLFDLLLGVGRHAARAPHAAVLLGVTLPDAEERIDAIRSALSVSEHPLLRCLAADARADLTAHEGVLGVENTTFGTALWHATRSAADPALPLRLLALRHDDRWCFEADRLCSAPRDQLRAIVQAVRSNLSHARPPTRVAEIARDPRVAAVLPAPGILLHVLRRILALAVSLHPVHGEIVSRRRASLATRLEALLDDAEGPLSADDLLFRYRDRHGKGSRTRIQDALRAGSVFLQVGGELWSLHARHIDELELLRPEAERRVAELRQTGRRMPVLEAVRHGEVSEQSAFLLLHLLRRDPGLRDLGRGEFVLRRRTNSALVNKLVADMRRAMGEVPLARFLQNQPASRRRLVATLMRCNRLFVSPAPDRVDLLDNYPFSGDRMTMLLRQVALCAEEGGGYVPLGRVRDAVNAAGLGGVFLTDHLLLDILRRHGQFELLPDAWVAAPGFGLVRWIQRTTRAILRTHLGGLTPQQIVAERPELAEFASCLTDLIDQDPLVHSADGLHYQLV